MYTCIHRSGCDLLVVKKKDNRDSIYSSLAIALIQHHCSTQSNFAADKAGRIPVLPPLGSALACRCAAGYHVGGRQEKKKEIIKIE